jgi:hypothetical protein
MRLLAALILFLGQCLAVAHATKHELSGSSDLGTCVICAVGHSPGVAPVAVAAPGLPAAARAALPSRTPPVVSTRPLYRPPSRGPPSILV